MATFGAGGLRAEAHFVSTATRGARPVFTESVPAADKLRIFPASVNADLSYALSRSLAGGLTSIDSGRRTGVWTIPPLDVEPSDAWMLGYTSDLAMAVWVGNRKEVQPLKDKSGKLIYGGGLPNQIFTRVMQSAYNELGRAHPGGFPPPVFAGDEHPPGAS
jgi:membrane peptidoglycan carboxypeptidase